MALTWIHIVGAARSGTTLMHTLMVTCFKVDAHPDHEESIFVEPELRDGIYCSKRPHDILRIGPLLRWEPNLWVIGMLRDPRDVIVSTHPYDPARYFYNLYRWRECRRAAAALADHPRFIPVRYEDLIRQPAETQAMLMARLPCLEKTGDFAAFHETATPGDRSKEVMKGVRPLSAKSIGAWRAHKARVLGQMERHGSLADELVALGYEPDRRWLEELDGIEPDRSPSFLREGPEPPLARLTRARKQWGRTLAFVLRRNRFARGLAHGERPAR